MLEFDLTYYKGKNTYSDGPIEDEILEIVLKKENIQDVLQRDTRWPVLYHFSPFRRNVLEWFSFEDTETLLEIGAGCGALTGLFSEKLEQVVAVELSKKRGEIICNRYKDRDNIKIIVGNFVDIPFRVSFDYVTLIGVLEYAKGFIEGKDPYGVLLEKIRTVLKKNGKLIIAIENRFGLKYFAGSREDHTGKLFEGIEGYSEDAMIETFGKQQICALLKSHGFFKTEFYYPFPDYKFPVHIFSDEYLPSSFGDLSAAPNYDADRYVIFNETRAYRGLIQEKKFDFFANSFLIVAS